MGEPYLDQARRAINKRAAEKKAREEKAEKARQEKAEKMSLSILLITNYFPAHCGGIEIITEHLARRYIQNGHHVTWIAAQIGEPPTPNSPLLRFSPFSANNLGEELLDVPYPVPKLSSIKNIYRELELADVVHIHDSLYVANALSAWKAHRLRKPFVVTQHTSLHPYKNYLLRILMSLGNHSLGRFVLSHSTQAVFLNEFHKSYFEKRVVFTRPPIVIPNGVDKEIFYPINSDNDKARIRKQLGLDPERFMVLFAGRFRINKGIDRMLALADYFKGVDFLFVGWGSKNSERWGLPNVKVFENQPQNELRNFYCAADLLVLPSIGEGSPLVPKEAMACGLPCMVSEGVAKMEKEAHEAMISTPLHPDQLRANLSRVLENREVLHDYKRRALAYSKKIMDWDNIAKQYLKIMGDLVNV